MAQHRQSGQHHQTNASSHVSVGIRSFGFPQKIGRSRRSARSERNRMLYGLSISSLVLVLCFALVFALSMFYFLSVDGKDLNSDASDGDDMKNDSDFLINVTRTNALKILKFGKESAAGGGDSRYWERDDRRRDQDYSEENLENSGKNNNIQAMDDGIRDENDSNSVEKHKKASNFHDKESQNELNINSMKTESHAGRTDDRNQTFPTDDDEEQSESEELDDELDASDTRGVDEMDDYSHKSVTFEERGSKSTNHEHSGKQEFKISKESEGNAHKSKDRRKTTTKSKLVTDVRSFLSSIGGGHASKTKTEMKKKGKRHSCEMKFLNISQIVEPLQTRKFARFSLQFVDREENLTKIENWEPKFGGHQSLEDREDSFLVNDKTIHCGFVKGAEASSTAGFDLAEDDANYISKCHVAVVSCIFGNSDRLRPPVTKMVTRLSRKNVCFVMFVDELTLRTLASENKTPDREGFVGLWKVVVVKNLPYADMRRVGKIPKLLSHRLFPSARYSIWLDSKLRFQVDPLLVLEYFLWRKGHEYAISNHYDRHCVWEEVAQNKRLNKYNHSAIDEQFAFYKADGLKKFSPLDPNKTLPSNVPEGSLIIRAHTPMSNLFSCLWFNEVERFTPRDQLSFAYTYQKLRRMNPDKPFYLNMFKDCERRSIAKLFRHRSEEKRNVSSATA